jgi:flagellar P-ring protein precursor FlgI
MADQVARSISSKMGASASAVNARLIEVQAPSQFSRVAFLAKLENITVQPSSSAPLVVINSRTGSVVMNESVQITAVAIAHGGLSIEVKNKPAVSQPNSFANGSTVVTNEAEVNIQDKAGKVYALGAATRLDQIVKALNTMGATPQDLIAILQAMKRSGALKAELEVI